MNESLERRGEEEGWGMGRKKRRGDKGSRRRECKRRNRNRRGSRKGEKKNGDEWREGKVGKEGRWPPYSFLKVGAYASHNTTTVLSDRRNLLA